MRCKKGGNRMGKQAKVAKVDFSRSSDEKESQNHNKVNSATVLEVIANVDGYRKINLDMESFAKLLYLKTLEMAHPWDEVRYKVMKKARRFDFYKDALLSSKKTFGISDFNTVNLLNEMIKIFVLSISSIVKDIEEENQETDEEYAEAIFSMSMAIDDWLPTLLVTGLEKYIKDEILNNETHAEQKAKYIVDTIIKAEENSEHVYNIVKLLGMNDASEFNKKILM